MFAHRQLILFYLESLQNHSSDEYILKAGEWSVFLSCYYFKYYSEPIQVECLSGHVVFVVDSMWSEHHCGHQSFQGLVRGYPWIDQSSQLPSCLVCTLKWNGFLINLVMVLHV